MQDLQLDATQCAIVAAWRLPEALPPARGNAHGDDMAAAMLGRQIFYDQSFAVTPNVSCASCHHPDLAFQDGMPVSEVIAGMPGARNSPSLYNAGRNEGFFFLDGRADSLWSQPLFALENEIEMATTRLAIAHRIHDVPEYLSQYEAIFGALPALDDLVRFPATGKPGDPTWEGMTDPDRLAINGVVANVGKAIEAYVRHLSTGPSAMDRYIDGDREAMTPEQRRGLTRFVQLGCPECHSGPMLTDGSFQQSTSAGTDAGRADGVVILLANVFNSRGPFFDTGAGPALPLPAGPTAADQGAFRTPTMRNVARTAPYIHNGSRDLETIVSSPVPGYVDGDDALLIAFFDALDGDPPPAEWATPP